MLALPLAVGKSTGAQISLRQIGAVLPAATGHHLLQTRAIATGARAKHAPTGLALRLFGAHALGLLGCGGFAQYAGAHRVDFVALVIGADGDHSAHRRIKQIHHVGESIAEKARHPQRHIHAGAVAYRHR